MNKVFTINFTLDSCITLKPIDFARIKMYIGDYSFSREKLDIIMSYIHTHTECFAKYEWDIFNFSTEESPDYIIARIYVKTKKDMKNEMELEEMLRE